VKGVIVAAGYGTRFLPVTKTIPKEMLPLYDKPIIDFILDEFEEAGIKDVIIVTSRRKKVLEDYLDKEVELENYFRENKKVELLNFIKPRSMNFYFVRQREMKGTGDALLGIKNLVSEDSFVVAYPDDVVLSKPGLTKRLIDLYSKTNKNVLAVRVENENLSRFGVIKPEYDGEFLFVQEIVEKPPVDRAPSNLVSIGRYLFKKELFDLLQKDFYNHKGGGEFYHINAINTMCKNKDVLAFEIDGIMLDTGDLKNYALSFLKYLDFHPEGREILDSFLNRRK
jgi:UTP--glucose-1-phosphate uridylyltransferase